MARLRTALPAAVTSRALSLILGTDTHAASELRHGPLFSIGSLCALSCELCRRNVFDESNQLRSQDELLADFAQLGIEQSTLVIPYCTGGIRSAFLYSVLRWVGLGRVSNYDGSWWDWSGNPNLPVVDPSATGGSAIG